MPAKPRRTFYLLGACIFAVGIAGYASVIHARAVGPAKGSVISRDADVLTRAVPSEILSEFLASEDAALGFREALSMPTRPGQEYHATLYLPKDQPAITLSAMAAGVVIARFDAKSGVAPVGLSPGKNYLWVDAKGPAVSPWRGIMISADGKTRSLLPGFKFTPASDHRNGVGPLEHARLYCNGAQGCMFFDQAGRETTWKRCDNGCCEVQLGPPPVRAKV